MEREERRRFAMIKIALVIGLAFVIQFVLSSFQMKNFNNEFVRLRRKGKVAIGRKSGGFHAGAIVMFRIDEKGIIQESRKIEGTTFLARVKDFPGFEGRYVGDLSVNDVEKSHKNLRKAVEDAARQFLQPKMIADSMGLDSMATLVLIYTGYKLNGMKGMILALLAGVIILSLYRLGLFDRKIKRMSRLLYEYRHCGADCEDDSNAKL